MGGQLVFLKKGADAPGGFFKKMMHILYKVTNLFNTINTLDPVNLFLVNTSFTISFKKSVLLSLNPLR